MDIFRFQQYYDILSAMGKKDYLNVLVVQSLRYKSSREYLSGVLDEMEDKNWHLTVARPSDVLSADDLLNEDDETFDGFILPTQGANDVMERLAHVDTPTVLVNMTDKRLSAGRGNFASVWTDNADIGRRAAKHFLECGEYKSAGYIHGPRREFYSEERMRAFRKAMHRSGYGTEVLPDGNGDGDYKDRIRQLLKRLPKPAAVMAVADMCAADAINICREEGFAVPAQVAVMGVDHDVSQHARCGMAISSVVADMRQLGRQSVKELDFLFRHSGGKKRPHEILVPAKGVFAGETVARAPAIATNLVERAQAFIAENRIRRLSPADVAAQLGCSRSLLKLRFRQIAGTTVRQAIEDARMDEVRRRILQGDNVKDIVSSMRFTSTNQFYRIYRRHFGQTIQASRTHFPRQSR